MFWKVHVYPFMHGIIFKTTLTRYIDKFFPKVSHIDDVLSLNNKNFSNFLHLIYPVELVVKDPTDSPGSAPYLDLYLEHDINGTLTTKLYDKRDDFNFHIVNYPSLDSKIPHLLHMVFTCRSWFDIREPVILIRIFYIDLSC